MYLVILCSYLARVGSQFLVGPFDILMTDCVLVRPVLMFADALLSEVVLSLVVVDLAGLIELLASSKQHQLNK